jgi:hypothetical protein
MITKATWDKIKQANDLLIETKYLLLEAEKQISSIDDKIGIIEIRNKVQQCIFSVIRFFRSEDKCSHDCKDCDSREIVGDEEHCLQGEEMK